jgi:hypothetical protein
VDFEAGELRVTRAPKAGQPLRFELATRKRQIIMQGEEQQGLDAWVAAFEHIAKAE